MTGRSVDGHWVRFHRLALTAVAANNAEEKSRLISELEATLPATAQAQNASTPPVFAEIRQPGYPESLALVHPSKLPRRSLGTDAGKACLLHAVAHIEYNAINLALDAVSRFCFLPVDYYREWLRVAAEEADHHQRIVARLNQYGFGYGDFPAHNGLWDIACRTAHDLTSRLALVPCVFEARGLDVTPAMIERLRRAGDPESAEVLQFILSEEIGHVALGIRWYRWACEQRGLDPIPHFLALVDQYLPNKPQGPFNISDRLAAGFTERWIRELENRGAGDLSKKKMIARDRLTVNG